MGIKKQRDCILPLTRESPSQCCVSLAVTTNQSSVCALATNLVCDYSCLYILDISPFDGLHGVCFPYVIWFKRSMLAGVIGFALGEYHSMILKQDGSVWSTSVTGGLTSPGGVIASVGVNKHFVQVIPSGVTAAAAGTAYSMVLKQDGTVWAMGRNARGQLGDGTKKAKKDRFSIVMMISGAKAVAAGGCHSLVLTQEGTIWATGWNKYGQLGDGSTSVYTNRFHEVISGAVAVTAGDLHSVILRQDGSVWATGRNFNGQLGDGSKADRNSFVKVMSSGAVNVAAGGFHSMVLKQNASVWAAGWNDYGQLGDGSTTDRINYVQVRLSGAKTIAAGRRHSLVLQEDGTVWATGYNRFGQLGDGSKINRVDFVKVIFEEVEVIAAGAFHSMALKQDGSIWATGSNEFGQFGDEWSTFENTFFRLVPFPHGAVQDDMYMTRFCSYVVIPFDSHNALNS